MTNAPRGKRNSLPSGLYFAMVDILRKYEISTREVEITLIRTRLKKNMDLFVIMKLIRLALVILKKRCIL
jgi:hypothetical protein